MRLNLSPTCQIKNLEELYIKYFKDKIGFFVEIGAFDGETFSNTSCLADIGWSGIYVEPVKINFQKCEERHKENQVKVYNLSIGTTEGDIEIYEGGSLSTTDSEQKNRYENIDWSKHKRFTKSICKQITLERLLNQNKVDVNFDLLVVDVEGQEVDVMNSFDLSYWKPKMIIVELEDEHQSFTQFDDFCKNIKALRSKIEKLGYSEIYRDKINTIYLYDNV